MEKAYEDTSNLITQKTQELSNTLDDMAHGFYDGMEHFISEKYKTVKQQLDSVIQGSNTAAKAPSDRPAPHALRPNPRFPNAKPLSSPIKSNSNAFKLPANEHELTIPNQMKQNELSSSEDEWSRFGPNKPEDAIEDFRPLPQLQAHKLVHHVKNPYPGKELTYTWYHTFRSAVKQYGILLIPVDEFKKEKSLCPRCYYGTKIDTLRYKDMADALYQFLILPDTIPSEYTDIRNILNRHASNTDGYSSLYKIMERINPL
ncbi:MAG: hypothetical protein ACK53Y_18235, partial [bacterium]